MAMVALFYFAVYNVLTHIFIFIMN